MRAVYLDMDDLESGEHVGLPVPCSLCGEQVETGAPVIGDEEKGFLAHKGCFDSNFLQARSDHALAHKLCGELLSHMSDFSEENGSHLRTALEGIEMAASFLRRLARDKGAPREGIQALRKQVSECAKSLYEAIDGAAGEEDEASSHLEAPIDTETSVKLGSLFRMASGHDYGREDN